tara:strand:- start:178 stop:1275 length:1098 start_codon:yes stop_codon:yes gene_type:complete
MSMTRTLKAIQGWISPNVLIAEEELHINRGDIEFPASFLTPASRKENFPIWIVLHGLTPPGRFHPTLVQFTRALTYSGAGVIVPEIPEWTRLELKPEVTIPTIRATLKAVAQHPLANQGPRGLIGFSFGAPQALVAATKTDIADQLAGVVSWGGYSDMGRILTFQMTGRHEWQGKEHTLTPDPYARWIVAGNYLPFVPEYREAQDVADALLHLAFEAGNRRVSSLSPSYDPLLKELATKIAPERKELFELFAPRSDQEMDIAAASRMATRLTECATTVTPLLNPGPYLPKVLSEVHLFHGRTDSLIPYTETLWAQTLLPQHRIASSTITGLFEHSERGNRLSSVFQAFGEVTSLVRSLNRVLGTV